MKLKLLEDTILIVILDIKFHTYVYNIVVIGALLKEHYFSKQEKQERMTMGHFFKSSAVYGKDAET